MNNLVIWPYPGIFDVFYIIIESSEIGPSICVHTGAPWGLQNIERDKDEAAKEILAHLKSILPGLPEPLEVKGHKWRYSQVRRISDKCPKLLYTNIPKFLAK